MRALKAMATGTLASAALGLCLAGGASAELLRWEGTLSLQVGRTSQWNDGSTGGGFATVNGSAGLGHLTTLAVNGGIAGSVLLSLIDPDLAPLGPVVGTMTLGSGVLRPISGAAESGGGLTQDVLPVGGHLKFCVIYGECISYLPVPLTVGGTRGMGIGGMLTINAYGPGVRASLYGAPWTIGVASITGLPTDNGGVSTISVSGFVHGPASGTSSTANISGVVQLVTPAEVVSTFGPDGSVWPFFGILTIHFVPEPQTFLLFAAGLTALGLGRRRRTRK